MGMCDAADPMPDSAPPARLYITADELLADSFRLGLKILDSGYRPTHIVGIWRGGTPVGIAVQELLDFCGVKTDHIAIRTSLYTGIGSTTSRVQVHGLNYIVRHVNSEDSLLIVDDVYDSGRSIRQVIEDMREECRKNTPEIRIATIYRKPASCIPANVPHYFLHDTDRWLVFPHELSGLPLVEILARKPGIDAIRERLLLMRAAESAPPADA
jgi:hypoxanthine phosphoribosyltransferase